MRIGVMGAHDGHISGMLASARKAPNAELVGIVEPDDQICKRLADDLPRFRTLEEMIEKARPELILEGLNHAEKTAVVETAAAAGIHLLLDKPLCRSREDWRRMRAAVDASGIRLSMWFTSRSYPPFVALQRAIAAGELGELVSLISTHPHRLSPGSPKWYWDPDVYTGTFHDLACHGVDQICWLTGAQVTAVHAAGTRLMRETSFDDHVQASLILSNGARALVTADWLTPLSSKSWGDTRMIVMGTKGSAHLRAYAGDHLLVVSDSAGTYEADLSTVHSAPFVESMITALESGEPLFIETADVFAVADACLAAQDSAAQGGALVPVA